MYGSAAPMKVKVERIKLLEILKKNRDNHASLVDEARRGYVEKARTILSEKLDRLKEGKFTAVSINLVVPEDHTSEYNTVIGMLQMAEDDFVELTADTYRQFVEDEWGWMSHWLVSNSGYSSGTRAYAETKGVDV